MASSLLRCRSAASPRASPSQEVSLSEGAVRAFVAVLLPDDVRRRLAATIAELGPRAPGLAWVRAESLHLTLRFLGELPPEALGGVREAVRAAATRSGPFTVALGGLGGFPSPRAPRVVWAGVTAGAAELGVLHAALEAALIAQGIPGEARAFHPHVTLARARARRGAGGLGRALGAGPGFGEVDVTALHLMRSELDPRGARYSVLAEAPLGDRVGDRET
jgi:2'-5' RNA ligase